jgi:hypothetical protein
MAAIIIHFVYLHHNVISHVKNVKGKEENFNSQKNSQHTDTLDRYKINLINSKQQTVQKFSLTETGNRTEQLMITAQIFMQQVFFIMMSNCEDCISSDHAVETRCTSL